MFVSYAKIEYLCKQIQFEIDYTARLMKRIFILLLFMPLLLPLSAMTHREKADSLVAEASRYYSEYRYMDALELLAQAVSVADETRNEQAYVRALLSIGNIHSIFKDYEQALHYYSQCYDRSKQMGLEEMCSRAGNNMLMCYCMMGNETEAQRCYDMIRDLNLENSDQRLFYRFLNQGLLARVKKDLHAAIFLHTQALEYAQNHEMDGHYAASQMGQIGTLEEELGNDEQAMQWYLTCETFSKQRGLMSPLVTCYERLAGLYRRQHNDSASIRYQRLYAQLTDSLFSEREFNSKRGQIVDYETRYNIHKISTLTRNNRALIIGISIIGLMLVALAFLIIYIFRQNRQLVITQRLLIDKHNELNQQLERERRLGEYLSAESKPSENSEESENAENPTDTPPLLTKQQTDLLLMAIAKVMDDSSIISDPDFSLQALATRVDSNTKYVSWAINATYGKNFKTYLNEYRIREAARRLADPQRYGNPTMATLAEQLGYKSPTSLTQAFKRIFGMTPAAYQKLVNEPHDNNQ